MKDNACTLRKIELFRASAAHDQWQHRLKWHTRGQHHRCSDWILFKMNSIEKQKQTLDLFTKDHF